MAKIEGTGKDLAKVAGGTIAKPSESLTVGQLERALLARFPRADAEEWDRMGLLAGDPAVPVTGVMTALDPTRPAIDAACAAGANVLLTHHPAFLDPPEAFSPSREVAPASGTVVYDAIAKGVALMNFHTALDVSAEAVRLLPGMLSLDFQRVLVPIGDDPAKGYGQLCKVRATDAPFKLSHLSARCTSVFGRAPRVWGDPDLVVENVVIANGSAGNVIEECVNAHVDCLICGEARYHASLDAWQGGLSIIEVGHDTSELPLAAVLARAAVDAGIDPAQVTVFDQGHNWASPESTRV